MIQNGPLFPRDPGYFGIFASPPQLPFTKQHRVAPANLIFRQEIVEIGKGAEGRAIMLHGALLIDFSSACAASAWCFQISRSAAIWRT